MRIEEELHRARLRVEASTSVATQGAVARGVRALIDSGDARRTIVAGEIAPGFVLPDENGTLVHLARLLSRGPLVLVFFRGGWCPFCQIDLTALEGIADGIRERGASIAAVSPQSAHEHLRLREELQLSFLLLSDEARKATNAYRLRWEVEEQLAGAGAGVGPGATGMSDLAVLPMPARFVIDTTGIVAYADVDPDFTRRPDPAELLPVLDRLQSRRS